ncbi:hypothetical protein E2C01_008223 [Portunus trituberculatus]|uniref:Uncharacterized protein n=1 Tax=Portunus trituberculatus TaxID=210409 RepID=A0A5B7D2J6_PORTR|nr:hypothetical protein [Portunus trituberculatus]
MRVGAGADFVQRNEALKKVCGEDHHKSAVEKTVYEKTTVNYVQMNASLDLSRCVWSDQIDHAAAAAAAAAGYCAALQDWISSGFLGAPSLIFSTDLMLRTPLEAATFSSGCCFPGVATVSPDILFLLTGSPFGFVVVVEAVGVVGETLGMTVALRFERG